MCDSRGGATPARKGEEMRKITVDAWKGVKAGQEVPDGYGKYKKAPSEPGVYTLYELADEDNFHSGWKWEKTE